jgi:nucleotide-binding universal stress UspA family protein
VRLILVPTAARPECGIALDVAFRLAKHLEANVTACHVRGERRESPAVIPELVPDDDVYTWLAQVAPDNGLTSEAAHELYLRMTKRHSFEPARRPALRKRQRALWHEMVGTPARIFSIIGPVCDLTIVSRPKAKSAGRAKAFLLAALLHSVKPVLIVPQKRLKSIGKTIVVAWNHSAEAALAVTAALPLLQRAERVIVVSSGSDDRPGPKARYLTQYLMNWDIKIEQVRTKGRDAERELEQAYRSEGGDLLVMGAYSRPRFRQLIFGGVTEHMLFKTEIPVFMLHR